MITELSIQENYPLHWSIWNNNLQGLKDGLTAADVSISDSIVSFVSKRLSLLEITEKAEFPSPNRAAFFNASY